MGVLSDPLDDDPSLELEDSSDPEPLTPEMLEKIKADPSKSTMRISDVRSIALAEREIQAVELRKAGLDYHEIARALKFPNQYLAQQAVKNALRKWGADAVDELRMLELMRLDTMTKKIWPKVLGKEERRDANGNVVQEATPPDPDMMDLYLKISTRRAKILGLDSPKQVELLTSEQALPGEEKVAALERFTEVIDALAARTGLAIGGAVEAEVVEESSSEPSDD